MANNIRTIVHFDADDEKMQEILDFIKPTKGRELITFHKIIPRSTLLNVPSGSVTNDAIYYALFTNRENKKKLMPWLEVLNSTKNGFLGRENMLQSLFCQYDMLFFYHDILQLDIDQDQKNWFQKALCSNWEKKAPEDVKKEYKYFTMIEYDDCDKSITTFLELGERYLDNLLALGATSWYEWSIKKWGTKWDAFSSSYDETEKLLILETANNAVLPIFAKLSEIFSDVKITVRYADEDIGYNCGMVSFLNGVYMDAYFPEKGSKAAVEFACEIWGYDSQEYLQ